MKTFRVTVLYYKEKGQNVRELTGKALYHVEAATRKEAHDKLQRAILSEGPIMFGQSIEFRVEE